MAAYTSWPDVLEKLINWLHKSKKRTEFSNLKTYEERLKFCIEEGHITTQLNRWLDIMCSSRHKKHWEKASELRVEGNSSFAEKKYEQAIEIYTQSILAAPFAGSDSAEAKEDELSLSFANRSAAFYHLKKFQDSLCDIDRALSFGYPKHLHHKLYLRKGQCLFQLNQKEEAMKALEQALLCLQDSRLDAKKLKNQEEEIEKYLNSLKNCSSGVSHSEVDTSLKQPDLSYGQHPHLINASKAIDVKCTPEKGRYVVASHDIRAGDILFVEKPYASVLLPMYYDTFCHHCYTNIDVTAVFPCHQCSQVRYCSKKCAEESWTRYHHLECGNLDLLHSVGIAHLTFRLMAVTGLRKLKEFLTSKTMQAPLPDGIPGFDEKGIYDNSYCSVFHLVTHSSDMAPEDAFPYSLTATLLLLLLERTAFFEQVDANKTSEGLYEAFKHLQLTNIGKVDEIQECEQGEENAKKNVDELRLVTACILLRHTQQLICNGHAITKLEVDRPRRGEVNHGVVSQQEVRIATAIYPTASLMNHSCDPTIVSCFLNDVLIVRAIKDVPVGGEVYNCYGPHYNRMSKSEREAALRAQYFFTCKCEPCVTDDECKQRFQALKCPKCEGPLKVPDSSGRSTCLDCQNEQDCTIFTKKMFSSRDLYVQGVQLADKGKYKDALEKFKKCLKLREQVMYKHNHDIAEVQDQLSHCYASLGDFEVAIELLKPSIEIIELQYGRNSIEVGHELQKLSDMQVKIIVNTANESGADVAKEKHKELIKEAQETLERALTIFSIYFGSFRQTMKDLEEKKSIIKDFL